MKIAIYILLFISGGAFAQETPENTHHSQQGIELNNFIDTNLEYKPFQEFYFLDLEANNQILYFDSAKYDNNRPISILIKNTTKNAIKINIKSLLSSKVNCIENSTRYVKPNEYYSFSPKFNEKRYLQSPLLNAHFEFQYSTNDSTQKSFLVRFRGFIFIEDLDPFDSKNMSEMQVANSPLPLLLSTESRQEIPKDISKPEQVIDKPVQKKHFEIRIQESGQNISNNCSFQVYENNSWKTINVDSIMTTIWNEKTIIEHFFEFSHNLSLNKVKIRWRKKNDKVWNNDWLYLNRSSNQTFEQINNTDWIRFNYSGRSTENIIPGGYYFEPSSFDKNLGGFNQIVDSIINVMKWYGIETTKVTWNKIHLTNDQDRNRMYRAMKKHLPLLKFAILLDGSGEVDYMTEDVEVFFNKGIAKEKIEDLLKSIGIQDYFIDEEMNSSRGIGVQINFESIFQSDYSETLDKIYNWEEVNSIVSYAVDIPKLDDGESRVLIKNNPGTVILKEDQIFEIADEAAHFPGGDTALIAWMKENMIYPEAAKVSNLQGTVFVQFIVEKDGIIKSPEIIKSISQELDKEALRLISSMPIWIPAKNQNIPVRSYVRLPVKFKL